MLHRMHLQQAVLRGLKEYHNNGSAIMYDSKSLEYRDFCESLYPNPNQFKCIVLDDHKTFYFVFYTAMR
jgi:hypothetical protein